MKQKKKWVIPLCVIGVILLLCAGGLWYMINHSMSFSVGRCLVCLLYTSPSPRDTR